jgi:hypothetical protein
MKKRIVLGLTLGLAALFMTSIAYPWNYATHAYISGQIGRTLSRGTFNEMYGMMLPDFLNLRFELWTDGTLRGYTHGVPAGHPYFPPSTDFMKVWKEAKSGLKKMVAFGYVAHNELWGADYVAHLNADPYDLTPEQEPGFIILLAQILMANIDWTPFDQLGLSLSDSDKMEFCHNIVEFAGDVLVAQADPLIGQKLFIAAAPRSPEIINLLKSVFPEEYGDLIATAEPEFHQQMALLGLTLLQPPETIISILAEQMAELSIDYFWTVYGLDISAYKDLLVVFGKGAIGASVELCQALGYMDVVDMTAQWVAEQLAGHMVVD